MDKKGMSGFNWALIGLGGFMALIFITLVVVVFFMGSGDKASTNGVPSGITPINEQQSSNNAASTTNTATRANSVPANAIATNQCTSGARECVGNGFRICQNTSGILKWSNVANCSIGEYCKVGFCNLNSTYGADSNSTSPRINSISPTSGPIWGVIQIYVENINLTGKAIGLRNSSNAYVIQNMTSVSLTQIDVNLSLSGLNLSEGNYALSVVNAFVQNVTNEAVFNLNNSVSTITQQNSIQCNSANACTNLTDKRCSGNGVQECVNVSGCLIWNSTVTCGGSENCANGTCLPALQTTTCTNDIPISSCTSTTSEVCTTDLDCLQPQQAPANYRECHGNYRCHAGGGETCSEGFCVLHQSWDNCEPCPYGCSGGVCLTSAGQMALTETNEQINPEIDKIAPNSSSVGNTIKIFGTGFDENSLISFGELGFVLKRNINNVNSSEISFNISESVIDSSGCVGLVQSGCYNVSVSGRKEVLCDSIECNYGGCTNAQCYDGDGGEDYLTSSFARGMLNGAFSIINDSCVLGPSPPYQTPEKAGKYLAEASCSNGEFGYNFISCAYGCLDGKCRQEEMTCSENDGGKSTERLEILEDILIVPSLLDGYWILKTLA